MSSISKRLWENRQQQRGAAYRSLTNDNRVYCRQAHRVKYRYETEKKANLAIKFGNGDIIRSYLCMSCSGWHTTSKTEQEYINNKQSYARIRPIGERRDLRD